MAESVKKQPEAPKLQPGRMQLQEHAYRLWVATSEIATTPEHLLDPAYWSNFASSMSPYDLIQVRCDDGTYWCEYLVLACDRTYAKVHPLRVISLTTQDVAATQSLAYDMGWKGPHKKFCVIRKSDGAIIHEGEQTKADALAWLSQNQKHVTA